MKMGFLKLGVLLLSFLWLGMGLDAMAKEPPIGMLTQAKGDVKYSKNGKKWKKVRRNKFLFAGYQIKTGGNGSGKFINQTTSLARTIGPNSVVDVSRQGLSKQSGTLSEPTQASGNLSSSLTARFKKAQRYTTVRRSVHKKKKLKLRTAKSITLSTKHPDLVWSNMGREYTYQLIVDGQTYNIPSTNNKVVRFPLPTLSPGSHKYQVNVMKQSSAVYTPRKASTIKWLSDTDQAKIANGLQQVENSAPGDDFLKANYLDENGMTVVAMDVYTKYFDENPDDTDMYPMLIKAYHDLKLLDLKKASALKLQDMIKAEEES